MAQAARAATSPVVRFVSADGVAYEPPAQLLYHAADPPNRVQSPLRWHSGPRASASPHVSPGLKRHRSPVLQRDSLKSRYSPGRPGSRRHQRWSNDQALAQDFTDEDLRELYAMDWRSALSERFDGNDKMQQWQDFCEASEEHQRAILMRFNKTSSPSAKTDPRRAGSPSFERSASVLFDPSPWERRRQVRVESIDPLPAVSASTRPSTWWCPC